MKVTFYRHSLFSRGGDRMVASPLTGIDPYLLMRIDPPELCSGFDPFLIF